MPTDEAVATPTEEKLQLTPELAKQLNDAGWMNATDKAALQSTLDKRYSEMERKYRDLEESFKESQELASIPDEDERTTAKARLEKARADKRLVEELQAEKAHVASLLHETMATKLNLELGVPKEVLMVANTPESMQLLANKWAEGHPKQVDTTDGDDEHLTLDRSGSHARPKATLEDLQAKYVGKPKELSRDPQYRELVGLEPLK